MTYLRRGAIDKPEPGWSKGDLPRDVVVGLDPSLTAYGVTLMSAHETDTFATWVVKPPMRGIKRLAFIRQYILTLLINHDVSRIVMEGYSYGSVGQAHKAGELGAAVKLGLWDAGLAQPHTMAPTSLKKFATGAGNTKKSEMLLHVFKRWGVEFDDDNAADSYALARVAHLLLGFDPDEVPKFQQECLSKLGKP